MRSIPLRASDGMAGMSNDPQRFKADVAQGYYDDGLVHNHNWAATSNVGSMTILRETPLAQTFTGSIKPAGLHRRDGMKADEHYDDGLVHNHRWAITAE